MQKNIVVLGGSIGLNGNVNPAAEANIFGDPDAANIVFSRVTKCHLLGLDCTHQCILSTSEIDEMKGKGSYGTFLHDITQFYLKYHRYVI
jgi:inosine-uridine nucleoside N-ribohydrolase